MARSAGLSQSAIRRIWRAFGLNPHRADTFKLSADPYFVEKVRNAVGLYMAPPERAVVLSADAKSQVPALDRTQPVRPMAPAQAERGTHDDVRHGTSTLSKEPGVSLHMVLDSYATHKTPAVKRWLWRRPEYHVHFTPTSSSGLNQIERFFAGITEKRLRRGVFKSVEALEQAITECPAQHNADPEPFTWVADADAILDRIKRIFERNCDPGHQDQAK
jgi:transposase